MYETILNMSKLGFMRFRESLLSEWKSQCHQVLISDAAISAGDVCLICQFLSSFYQLSAAPSDVPQGTGIFLNNDELVGVVAGASDLALDADYFSFV